MTALTKPEDLTVKQFNFALNYIALGGNASAAYRASYDAANMKPSSVVSASAEVLSNPRVAMFIADLEARKVQAVMDGVIVTEQMIVNLLWQIATADPNELIAHRRVCCRYCHGDDHQFQWRDLDEWMQAVESEAAAASKEKRPAKDVPFAGGVGFDKIAEPHPDCPRCRGEGHGDVTIADTNKLTGSARRLYAGVKVTRDGIEVKMRDQDKALDTLATYAGLRKDKGDAPKISMLFGKVTREIIDSDGKTIEGSYTKTP